MSTRKNLSAGVRGASREKNTLREKNTPRAPYEEMSLPGEELWRPLYPFQSRYTRLGGFTCHYIDEYEAALAWHSEARGKQVALEDLPSLLFVHGNPTWSFYWRSLMTAFRDRYRIVALDHVGCGLSEKPESVDYPFTLARRISDLSGLIQKISLHHITLVAHDWGGAIGLGAAERSPRRFERFALMNTGAFRFPGCPLRIRMCRFPLLGQVLVQGFNVFARAATRMATVRKGGLAPEVAAGLLAPYSSWVSRTGVYQFVRDIPLSEKHRSWNKLAEVEQGLSQFRDRPVSLIWGMQDWCFTAEFLKRFLQFFPEADVRRIDDAGHYVVEDAPDQVRDALEALLKKPVSPAGKPVLP